MSGGVQVSPDKLRSSYLVMSRQRSGLRISARLCAGAHDGVWVFLCIFIYVLQIVHIYYCGTINRTFISFLALNLRILTYFFFHFPPSQKSPIYWTYVFSFLIPYYYPFCQISFFLFKIFMNSPPLFFFSYSQLISLHYRHIIYR